MEGVVSNGGTCVAFHPQLLMCLLFLTFADRNMHEIL